jgi:hypothetical protein
MEHETGMRQPISEDVLKLAGLVADRSIQIVKSMETLLAPVSRPAIPLSEKSALGLPVPEQVYPPLFNSLRDYFKEIDSRINEMEEILSRVEL